MHESGDPVVVDCTQRGTIWVYLKTWTSRSLLLVGYRLTDTFTRCRVLRLVNLKQTTYTISNNRFTGTNKIFGWRMVDGRGIFTSRWKCFGLVVVNLRLSMTSLKSLLFISYEVPTPSDPVTDKTLHKTTKVIVETQTRPLGPNQNWRSLNILKDQRFVGEGQGSGQGHQCNQTTARCDFCLNQDPSPSGHYGIYHDPVNMTTTRDPRNRSSRSRTQRLETEDQW